jgi:ribosomal protein S18 acetylase RimI-like enzyme
MLYGQSTYRPLQIVVSRLTMTKALDEQDNLIGVIVCKLEPHRGGPMRGYIAMLATRSEYRGQGIATKLVRMAIDKMIEKDADEVSDTYDLYLYCGRCH